MRCALVLLVACSGSSTPATTDAPRPGDGSGSGGLATVSFEGEMAGAHTDATHSSIAVTFGLQTAGDLTVVIASWETPAATLTSLTDTAGQTYVLADSVTAGSIVQQLYVAPTIAATTNVVTAQFSANAQNCGLRVLEYRGLATASPVDAKMTASGTDTTESAGPITTTHPHDLLLAAFTGAAGAPGTGFTGRVTFNGEIVEDREVLTAGSYTATATGITAAWVAGVYALSAAD